MSIPSIPPAASVVSALTARGGEAPAPPPAAAGAPSQAQSAPQVQATSQSTSADELGEALARVREALAPVARNLQFSVDDDTGKTVVRIIDSTTNEVIRQMPSEEMLAISRSIDKLQGLLLRQEA